MPKKLITYDPSRLIALARRRDDARALVLAGNDKYQDMRARLNELRLMASNVLMRGVDSRFHVDVEAERDRLNGQADALAAQMRDLEEDTGMKAKTANDAGRILASCLKFAVAEGLEVPAELAAEASREGGKILSISGVR